MSRLALAVVLGLLLATVGCKGPDPNQQYIDQAVHALKILKNDSDHLSLRNVWLVDNTTHRGTGLYSVCMEYSYRWHYGSDRPVEQKLYPNGIETRQNAAALPVDDPAWKSYDPKDGSNDGELSLHDANLWKTMCEYQRPHELVVVAPGRSRNPYITDQVAKAAGMHLFYHGGTQYWAWEPKDAESVRCDKTAIGCGPYQ